LCFVKEHGNFFVEATVTGLIYLDILEEFLLSQLQEDFQGQLSFQQDGAAPDFPIAVRDILNEKWLKA
jgi:hypothetical protein